jgi:hypothetical protein
VNLKPAHYDEISGRSASCCAFTRQQFFGRSIFLKETVMSESENHNVHEDPQQEQSGKSETSGEAKVLLGLRECARITTDALCDAGHKASVSIKELGDSAYQVGSRTGARVARQVEAQPMTAALVAASLGLIIGVLLPRR